ncbi:MerR family transcriptional regulator [Nocardia nova]|nr:MerR family transcriptional regulator [Nocardia nova]
MRSTPEDAESGIGAVARRFGLAEHVLRHWESEGLLEPARDTAGRRRYRTADLVRVAMILRAKQAGLGLEAIREMFEAPVHRREILRRQRAALTATIAAAQSALTLVDCALDCEHDDFTRCPHFHAAVAEHLGGEP